MAEIKESTQNGVTIFAVVGRIDSEGAMDLDIQLHAAIAEGKTKMILDMSELKYINSAGLRTLADVLTQNKADNGDLKLVGMNNKIRRVFEIVGFDNFFAIHPTLEAALAEFA